MFCRGDFAVPTEDFGRISLTGRVLKCSRLWLGVSRFSLLRFELVLISVVVITSHVGPRARGQFAVLGLPIVMEFEYPVTARPVSSDVHFCCRLFVSVTVSDGASLIVFFPAERCFFSGGCFVWKL
uniref:(northern house mosquito) hypothetical protein n=1 Tax=Culex pipiens TaxID=7175 RepID=A0A8D8EZA5_CULPI